MAEMQQLPDLMRLKSQLLTSGLSQKNQPLFQVIDQLIDYIRKGNEISNVNFSSVAGSSSSGGGSSILSPSGVSGFPSIEGLDGLDGIDGMPGLPGAVGSPGLIGRTGPQGIPGIDGIDGADDFESLFYDNDKFYPQIGTWTPNDASGAGLAITVNSAYFIKFGPMAFLQGDIIYPVTASGLNAKIGGIPTVITPLAINQGLGIGYYATIATALNGLLVQATGLSFNTGTAGAITTNAQMSTSNVIFSGTYRVS